MMANTLHQDLALFFTFDLPTLLFYLFFILEINKL